MGSFYTDWDAAWATDSVLNAASIAAAATATGDARSNDLKLATEVSVTLAFGATAADVTVYILRDVDGTNYEAVADKPFGFTVPGTASTTVRRTVTIRDLVSAFKVLVSNPTGNSTITATVRYRQAVGTTA